MSLLTIIGNVAATANVPVPSAIVSSTDASSMQFLRFFNMEGVALQKAIDWQALIKTHTFVTIAAVQQTDGLTEGTTNNFKRMTKTGEVWNDTENLPLFGPMPSAQWTALRALSVPGVGQYWRIQNNAMHIYPIRAGMTITYDYISKYWTGPTAGSPSAEAATSDNDVVVFPEDLMEKGILWRWKQAKGLDYAEEMRNYELAKLEYSIYQDGGTKTYSVGDYYEGFGLRSGRERTWPGTVTP